MEQQDKAPLDDGKAGKDKPGTQTSVLLGLFIATTLAINSGCSYAVYPTPHRHVDVDYNGICDVCGASFDELYSRSGHGYYHNGHYYAGPGYSNTKKNQWSSFAAVHGISRGAKGGIGSAGSSSGG